MRAQLRAARERRSWSPEVLARRSGVNARTIEVYETSDVEPSWTNVVALARALDLSLDELGERRAPVAPLTSAEAQLLSTVERTIAEARAALADLQRSIADRQRDGGGASPGSARAL